MKPTRSGGWSSKGLSIFTIGGAWTVYLLLVGLRLAMLRLPNAGAIETRHLATAAAGAGLTFVLYVGLRKLEGATIGVRIAAALLISIPPAMLLAVINYNIMFVFAPAELWSAGARSANDLITVSAQTIAENYFLFAGWTTLYTAISSAIQGRDALLRSAELEVEARAAQLQALRYQLDPHFLFNALNTVSALVMENDPDGAEAAIDALSSFLRHTLTLDASEDTSLVEEIHLQELYLRIEKVRFGKRLQTSIVLPAALEQALIPPLLLQPLVENVITHAVARSNDAIMLKIKIGSAGPGMLEVSVEDDGPAQKFGEERVGLTNVRRRLAARYGAGGKCDYGPMEGRGFCATLTFPLCYREAA